MVVTCVILVDVGDQKAPIRVFPQKYYTEVTWLCKYHLLASQ